MFPNGDGLSININDFRCEFCNALPFPVDYSGSFCCDERKQSYELTTDKLQIKRLESRGYKVDKPDYEKHT